MNKLTKHELVNMINALSDMLDIDNKVSINDIDDSILRKWNLFLNTYRVKRRFTLSDLIIPKGENM